MDVFIEMSLFQTYLKPLLCYGIKLLEINCSEKGESKRIEGNFIIALKLINNKLFFLIEII